MIVYRQDTHISAAQYAHAARELAAEALARSAADVDPDGFWPLDYHAWLHAADDGERMALDAARSGVGGGGIAAKRTQIALERGGDLRPVLAARGRDLAEEAAAAGLAKGCCDANWRRRYVARYVSTASARFFLACEEPEVLALQARAEAAEKMAQSLQAASGFGLTGRSWLN